MKWALFLSLYLLEWLLFCVEQLPAFGGLGVVPPTPTLPTLRTGLLGSDHFCVGSDLMPRGQLWDAFLILMSHLNWIASNGILTNCITQDTDCISDVNEPSQLTLDIRFTWLFTHGTTLIHLRLSPFQKCCRLSPIPKGLVRKSRVNPVVEIENLSHLLHPPSGVLRLPLMEPCLLTCLAYWDTGVDTRAPPPHPGCPTRLQYSPSCSLSLDISEQITWVAFHCRLFTCVISGYDRLGINRKGPHIRCGRSLLHCPSTDPSYLPPTERTLRAFFEVPLDLPSPLSYLTRICSQNAAHAFSCLCLAISEGRTSPQWETLPNTTDSSLLLRELCLLEGILLLNPLWSPSCCVYSRKLLLCNRGHFDLVLPDNSSLLMLTLRCLHWDDMYFPSNRHQLIRGHPRFMSSSVLTMFFIPVHDLDLCSFHYG